MTTPKKTPKRCPTCGQGTPTRFARAGRKETHRGYEYELPADLSLLECRACGEVMMTPADIDAVDAILEAKHRERLSTAANRAIEQLLQSEPSVGAIEARLRLSPGYLSRLRSGASEPSFQLVALLGLLARRPALLHELDDLVATAGA